MFIAMFYNYWMSSLDYLQEIREIIELCKAAKFLFRLGNSKIFNMEYEGLTPE